MRNFSKYLLVLLSLLAVLAFSGISETLAQGANPTMPANYTALSWYLVCEMDQTGQVTVLSQMQVELAAPLTHFSDKMISDAFSAPNRNDQPLVAKLVNGRGEVVFQKIERLSGFLRAESGGKTPQDPIQGHFVEQEKTIFLVRVPVIQGSTLTLQKFDSDVVTTIDFQTMVQTVPEIAKEKHGELQTLGTPGNPENRVDILFMGDGYTQSEQDLYLSNINFIKEGFFNITPLQEYENYHNVHVLFTPSNQSGSDFPTYNASCPGDDNPNCCRDWEMQSNPKNGTFVDTFFDGRFCGYHIFRLVMVNYQKVLEQAGINYPDFDMIFVILNEDSYGGSALGNIAVLTFDGEVITVAQHEFGHSFGDLADEYSDAYPGFPSCSDISGNSPCETNVTNVKTREQVKWRFWIAPELPVPTPPGGYGPEKVGLFEGARYFSSGIYRSGQSCLMRSLFQPFCALPTQSMVMRLYQGGWGKPAGGISQIEPGSTSPEETVINLTHPASQTFTFELLQPVGGPASRIQWYEGMMPINGANGTSFTYHTKDNDYGQRVIRVGVKDTTELVHPQMAGNTLSSNHSWTVNVTGQIVPTATPLPTPTPPPTPTLPPVEVFKLYLPISIKPE